jgi:hypothetical protein
MALRHPHSRVGDGVRILGTVLIALHLFLSAWLVIQFEGQYTEGQPAPTKVNALVAIDKEQTLIDVEMENATSFLLYMLFRDYDEPVNASQQNTTQDNSDDETPSSESEDEGETIEWLKYGRNATLFSLVFLCVTECLVVAGIRFKGTLRAFALTFALACFLVIMPASYVLDLTGYNGGGDDGDDGEEDDSSLADETFVAQTEQGSFAHRQSSVEHSLLPTGIRFDLSFSGYDLGLVEPENYSSLRNEPPQANDSDADSFVEFQSALDLTYGKNIPYLFFIPLMWIFLPQKPGNVETNSEQEEE